MTAPLAIGVGCRRGCPEAIIRALVVEVRSSAGAGEGASLFTIADKRDEPGLSAAAAALGLALHFLPREALRAVLPRVVTRSAAAEARFGVASVAEAAALAGAGRGARLVVPRVARGGATAAAARLP